MIVKFALESQALWLCLSSDVRPHPHDEQDRTFRNCSCDRFLRWVLGYLPLVYVLGSGRPDRFPARYILQRFVHYRPCDLGRCVSRYPLGYWVVFEASIQGTSERFGRCTTAACPSIERRECFDAGRKVGTLDKEARDTMKMWSNKALQPTAAVLGANGFMKFDCHGFIWKSGSAAVAELVR